MSSKSKQQRRDEAAARAAAGEPTIVEEGVTDESIQTTEGAQGSGLDDQDSGLVQASESIDQPGQGSDEASSEVQSSEGLVGDESDGAIMQARGETPVLTHLDELPFLPPAGDEPATLGVSNEVFVIKDDELPEGITAEGLTQEGGDIVSDEPLIVDRDATLLTPEAFDPNITPIINPEIGGQMGFVPAPEEPAPKDMSVSQLRAKLEPIVGKDSASAWSREEMILYFEKGVQPSKTSRGNWIYDARRGLRVTLWSASELLDFVEGRLNLGLHTDEELVWDEVYSRYKVPTNWSREALRQFVCDGSIPEYTPAGVLINDRMRDQKKLGHLTYAEIKAALLKQIDVKFSDSELIGQYRTRLGIGKSISDARLLAELPNQPNEVSMDNVILRSKLEEYKVGFTKNPTHLTEKTAGDCQGMLYKAVRDVMRREYADFAEGWNIILDFINDHYALLFSAEKARRGWPSVALSSQQLALFEDVLTLMIHTRDPKYRAQAAATYNLETILRHLPIESERRNLFMYYTNE